MRGTYRRLLLRVDQSSVVLDHRANRLAVDLWGSRLTPKTLFSA